MLVATSLMACAGKDGSNGLNGEGGQIGTPGNNGNNGQNGHSIVGISRAATALECSQSSGVAVDFFIDTDDTQTVTDEDILQSGVVSCNGLNGTNGVDGQDGTDGVNGTNGTNGVDGAKGDKGDPGAAGSSAVMTAYSLPASFTCYAIHSGIYAYTNSTTQISLYTNSNCTTQIDTNNFVLDATLNEIYVNSTLILILEKYSTGMVLRKLVW